jgi:hypothetical protein
MAKIVTPSIRRTYSKLIKQVVADLNKKITAYMPPDTADCPNCFFDFSLKKSSGKFDSSFVTPVEIFGETISPISFTRSRCPVCYGAGELTSAVTKSLKALVKWNPKTADEIVSTPAGRESSPIVRIKVLRVDFDTLVAAEYFIVDGIRCEMNEPPTIRGLGEQEELVVAFLISTPVGSDVKG